MGQYAEFLDYFNTNREKIAKVVEINMSPHWRTLQQLLGKDKVALQLAARSKVSTQLEQSTAEQADAQRLNQDVLFKLLHRMQATHKSEILRRLRQHQTSVDREQHIGRDWSELRTNIRRTIVLFRTGASNDPLLDDHFHHDSLVGPEPLAEPSTASGARAVSPPSDSTATSPQAPFGRTTASITCYEGAGESQFTMIPADFVVVLR